MSDTCFYCAVTEAHGGPKGSAAVAIFHDQRGCVPVCAPHKAWRRTTSRMGGHSRDCPRPHESNDDGVFQ